MSITFEADAIEATTLTPEVIYDPIQNVQAYTGLSRSQIYKCIREDGFPEPYQLGKRSARWNRAEVLEWIESRPRGTRMTPMDIQRQTEGV